MGNLKGPKTLNLTPGILLFFFSLSIYPKSVIAKSENVIWKVNLGKNIQSLHYSLEVDPKDNSVYTIRDNKIIKVSSEGTIVWEYTIPEPNSRRIEGSPILFKNYLLAVSGQSGAYAYFLDKNTGELAKMHEMVNPYKVNTGTLYYSKPALSYDKRRVYIYLTSPEFLYGFDTESLSFIGKGDFGYIDGGPAYSPQVISIGEIMYIGTLHGTAYSFYPYGQIDGFYEEGIDQINFGRSPSPLGGGGQFLLGPIIDYSNNALYYVDRRGSNNRPSLISLNLADGKTLKEIDIGGFLTDTYSTPVMDNDNNVFVLTGGIVSSVKNTLYKINPNSEEISTFEFETSIQVTPNVEIDKEGNVYISLDKLYKISNDLSDILLEVPLESTSRTSAGSAPVLTKDQKYVYVESRDGVLYKVSTGFSDPGCIRKRYCTTKPKHRPIIFIHGLGGKQEDWLEGGNKAPIRDLILRNYKEDDKEYPDEWAYAYHYGYDSQGKYNYQGDIRQIAKGMQEDVARLSYEYKEAGGDGKVDLVGFSLGGQVIREYLAKMVRNPETTEDDRPINVGKAIIIASPNKGSWAYAQREKIPWPLSAAIAFGVNDFIEDRNKNGQPIKINATALVQIEPDSAFMKRVAARTTQKPDYYLLYGDISAGITQKVFGVGIKTKLSFGDTLVTTESASDLPGIINEKTYSFDSDINLELKIKIAASQASTSLEIPTTDDYYRWRHKDLIKQPEVRNKILNILLDSHPVD